MKLLNRPSIAFIDYISYRQLIDRRLIVDIPNSDTVEDLIRISVERPSLEDVDAREKVASWFSQGQRSRRPNYRSWPSEGHVTAMEDSP